MNKKGRFSTDGLYTMRDLLSVNITSASAVLLQKPDSL